MSVGCYYHGSHGSEFRCTHSVPDEMTKGSAAWFWTSLYGTSRDECYKTIQDM